MKIRLIVCINGRRPLLAETIALSQLHSKTLVGMLFQVS